MVVTIEWPQQNWPFCVNGGGKLNRVGGSMSACGVAKLYRPRPFIRLITSLWRVRWMFMIDDN